MSVKLPHVYTTSSGDQRPVKDHVGNTQAVMRHYDFDVRFNVMSKRLEFSRKSEESRERQNQLKATFANLCAEAGLSRAPLDSHLWQLAERYHPVEEWLDSVIGGWDGRDRWPEVWRSLAVMAHGERLELCEHMLRTWCRLAAALATCSPNPPVSQGALVLQGAQGVGKSRWLRALAGGAEWFRDGLHLDVTDRDSVHSATSVWIVELGEVDATFRKSDVAALKAFLTKQADTYRLPYAVAEETYLRRTAYAATVNPVEFLVDETGNRRWWTLPIGRADVTAVEAIDVRQFWLQMRHEVRAGAATHLVEPWASQLTEANTAYQTDDPVTVCLRQRYIPGKPGFDRRYTIAQLLEQNVLLSKLPATRQTANRISRALAEIGVEGEKVGGNRVWYLHDLNPAE